VARALNRLRRDLPAVALKSNLELASSEVVANNAMNRLRGAVGPNSYARELGLDPIAWLERRVAERRPAVWIDLCCGSGHALLDCARRFDERGQPAAVRLIGVDLVDHFAPGAEQRRGVTLQALDVCTWSWPQPADLVTCVHGLHYLGDKLGVVALAVRSLAEEGLFVANFDPDNLRGADGAGIGPVVIRRLREAGMDYDPRRHLLRARGPRDLSLPARFLGADDSVGPNYTGQPAVDSYYALSAP
jgi:SAM-dependent methyltransferase